MAINKTNIKDINTKNFAEFDLGLLCEDRYKDLKHIDMVVYTLLNNQHGLSVKTTMAGSKRFVDSNGYIFISIGQEKLGKLLRTTKPTLNASLKRLEEAELVQVVNTGNMKCNRIYIGELERTITLGDYMKDLNVSEEEHEVVNIKTLNIKEIKEKAEGETSTKTNNSNTIICNNNKKYAGNKKQKVGAGAHKQNVDIDAVTRSTDNKKNEELKKASGYEGLGIGKGLKEEYSKENDIYSKFKGEFL